MRGLDMTHDFQDFAITPAATASIAAMPRFTISCRLTDSVTGETLRDFTGANTLTFPDMLKVLNATQREEFVRMAALWIINARAGL